jgi:transcription initiation factor TFIID subunit 6
MSDSLNPNNEADAAVINQLREVLGDVFAERVAGDAAWAREVLGITNNST